MKENSFAAPAFAQAAANARAHSPFLSRLLQTRAELATRLAVTGPEAAFEEILASAAAPCADTSSLMRALRRAKADAALVIALCDLAGEWSLSRVTGALSQFADTCVAAAVSHLTKQAYGRGEIEVSEAEKSGLIVLGMGKLGARELNYSSDIDLILFYEPGKIGYRGKQSEQHFMNRLSRELVSILQERTGDGYVFRTDLRLRPDPAAMPPAISIAAALLYYESVGQNWERAALIKARAVAGDRRAGEDFLKQLAPFLWRKYLDFAAIQDIHSLKRQMDGAASEIRLPGCNVKTGLGGIREIEFFTQIHQLIWGGKLKELRLRGTCETLSALARAGLIDAEKSNALSEAYAFLRKLEHRLQMVDDRQTHSLPASAEALAETARFMGYEDAAAFERETLAHLNAVHAVFKEAFQAETLGAGGNLVFTGVSHDPDTLRTLKHMGFRHPETVSETVMGWHHGSRRCTRTRRARELLTELMPDLLQAFAETPDADAAFLKFDEFLRPLPAGVQLFSLFTANRKLLSLIADIMGSAPALAEILSRNPALLESVLYGDFYDAPPDRETLDAGLDAALAAASGFEARLEALTRFKNERQFQAGVQLLQGIGEAERIGAFLADLAEAVLQKLLAEMEKEFMQTHGRIPGARFAVLALGALGSREMGFGSDLDLIFLYDATDMDAYSDGEKSFNPSVYYNRLTPRIVHALSALTREGRLYEADTRLRPFGGQGLSAISLSGLVEYFDRSAWTFEAMALCKARAAAGDNLLRAEAEEAIADILSRARDAGALKREVGAMRARVAEEFPPERIWDVKHAAGGLMEIDFLCQYLRLAHGAEYHFSARGGASLIAELDKAGFLSGEAAKALKQAHGFLTRLHAMLKLCTADAFSEETASSGLKRRLAAAAGCADFEELKTRLKEVETRAHLEYKTVIES